MSWVLVMRIDESGLLDLNQCFLRPRQEPCQTRPSPELICGSGDLNPGRRDHSPEL
jgi:hypothetical protein